MQINSTSNISDQYLSALQSKQKETATKSFEEELIKESTTQTVETLSSVKSVDEQQPERYHEVFTYANTKGMTSDEIDKYFSERTEEEREHIKLVVGTSNVFSEDDIANEAVFNELKQDKNFGNSLRSTNFFTEKDSFARGTPLLNNVLEISNEFAAAMRAGVKNPQAQGIFMNAEDKARYESRDRSINQVTFTSTEAADFLSTMTQLAKDKMDEARGTAVFDDYKEAFERYQRLTDNYNSLLANKEEDTTVDIQV